MNRPPRRPHAFTVIECAVVVVLIGMLTGMAHAFATGATRSSRSTQSSEDASRALLIAAETIGLDLRRALIEDETADLEIAGDGRTAAFRTAVAAFESWSAPFQTVRYSLEPARRGQLARRLVRHDARGARALPACLLKDIVFQLRPQAAATPWRRTVLVTLVAPLNAHDDRVVSIEVPVSRALPPPAYPWPAPGGSR